MTYIDLFFLTRAQRVLGLTPTLNTSHPDPGQELDTSIPILCLMVNKVKVLVKMVSSSFEVILLRILRTNSHI